MATVVAMELDQSDGSKGGSKTAALLSINKSSGSRISKSSSLRSKSASQQQQQQQTQQASGNKPMPSSKVYNTDPMSFRNLVQQLTGCEAPAPAQAQPSPPHPPPPQPQPSAAPPTIISSYPPQSQAQIQSVLHNQQQIDAQLQLHHHQQQQQQQMVFPDPGVLLHQQGSPTSSGGGFASGARPVNTRLQRMAPPPIPIRPAFSFNLAHRLQQQAQMQQQMQQNQAHMPEIHGGEPHKNSSGGASGSNPPEIPSPGAHPLSPISKRVSPMPLLSFSPLPVLSPSDNAWASFESPNTAAMKQLAQSILDGKSPSPLPGARFPWSPLGLQSPGLAPELFPDVKMIEGDSGNSSINSSSVTSSGEFSFPELPDS